MIERRLHRLLTYLNGCAIRVHVTRQYSGQMLLDQRFLDMPGQLRFSEAGQKSARSSIRLATVSTSGSRRSASSYNLSTTVVSRELYLSGELATERVEQFSRHELHYNSLEWGRPEPLTRGSATREAGSVGMPRLCFKAPASPSGSHPPSENIAPTCAIAPFRVVASCPDPKTAHSAPSNGRFRFNRRE